MVQNPGKFKIPEILFFLEFGQSCTQSDHSAHSILAVSTTLLHARKVKWLPSGNGGNHSVQNLLSLLKISACYPKTLIVLMFVALVLFCIWNKGSHNVGRTQIVWVFENRVQKRIFQARNSRSREKIYNEKLNNPSYLQHIVRVKDIKEGEMVQNVACMRHMRNAEY